MSSDALALPERLACLPSQLLRLRRRVLVLELLDGETDRHGLIALLPLPAPVGHQPGGTHGLAVGRSPPRIDECHADADRGAAEEEGEYHLRVVVMNCSSPSRRRPTRHSGEQERRQHGPRCYTAIEVTVYQ